MSLDERGAEVATEAVANPADVQPLGTRAVMRIVDAGIPIFCIECTKRITYNARKAGRLVVANVYEDGKWDRMERFHPDCYSEADEPYGAPKTDQLRPPLRRK